MTTDNANVSRLAENISTLAPLDSDYIEKALRSLNSLRPHAIYENDFDPFDGPGGVKKKLTWKGVSVNVPYVFVDENGRNFAEILEFMQRNPDITVPERWAREEHLARAAAAIDHYVRFNEAIDPITGKREITYATQTKDPPELLGPYEYIKMTGSQEEDLMPDDVARVSFVLKGRSIPESGNFYIPNSILDGDFFFDYKSGTITPLDNMVPVGLDELERRHDIRIEIGDESIKCRYPIDLETVSMN